MHTSLPVADLERYILDSVATHLPDGYYFDHERRTYLKAALDRVEHCFTAIHRKYYNEVGVVRFNHLHADHMATLLYFYANQIWTTTGDTELPTRLSYLNKILHGLDLFYDVALPKVFLLVHPLGTVLGHATYGNYLVVYQGVTVGACTTTYPTLGEGVILYSRSSVLGECTLGDDVVVAANTLLIDTNVSGGQVVTGQHPMNHCYHNSRSVKARCFE